MQRQKVQRLAILLVILVSNRGLSAVNAASPINQTQILDFLNETINWYQQIAVEQPKPPSPNDVLFAASNLPLSEQIVKLSFDFGRAEAQLTSGVASSTSRDSRYRSLAASASKVDIQLGQTQTQLDSLKQKLKSASVSKRKDILSAIAETESKL